LSNLLTYLLKSTAAICTSCGVCIYAPMQRKSDFGCWENVDCRVPGLRTDEGLQQFASAPIQATQLEEL